MKLITSKPFCLTAIACCCAPASSQTPFRTTSYFDSSDLRPPHTTNNAIWAYYAAWDLIPAREELDELAIAIHALRRAGRDPAPALTAPLEKCQSLVDAILAASRAPTCDWGVPAAFDSTTNIGAPQVLMQTANLLAFDARRCAAAHQPVQAAERLAAIFRLADHAAQLPFLVGPLIGVVIADLGTGSARDLLERGELSIAAARQIIIPLNALLAERDFLHATPAFENDTRRMMCEFRAAELLPAPGPRIAQLVPFFSHEELERWTWPLIVALATATPAYASTQFDRADRFLTLFVAAWKSPDPSPIIGELCLEAEEGQWGLVPMIEFNQSFGRSLESLLRARLGLEALSAALTRTTAEGER